MRHADIIAILKDHFSQALERFKEGRDNDGQIPRDKLDGARREIQSLEEMIAKDVTSYGELWGLDGEQDEPYDTAVQAILDKYELDIKPNTPEYTKFKHAYIHAKRNHFTDLITYNDELMNYSLLQAQETALQTPNKHHRPEYRLDNMIERYLAEIKSTLSKRSYTDKANAISYLIDFLGKDHPIATVTNIQVQEIKQSLTMIPTGRNKKSLTKGRTITEQIKIADEHDLERLKPKTGNHYLGYFTSLYDWAKSNSFAEDNPFEGIKIKDNQKNSRRDHFPKDDIRKVLNELETNALGLIKNKSQYWGTLLAIYTGARRNEIASLTVANVKQDSSTGIRYFDITDEEESQSIKTSAGVRYVPIHPRLIELGFLDFVEEAKKQIASLGSVKGKEPRLLYDLTYTEHDKWGRKLGRFVNESLLPKLGLHVKNKKVLHSFRHSFITFLSTASVDGKTISALAGHESNTVTESVYTHRTVEHLTTYMEAIEKLEY